ncbi:MAG: hypothetical protein AAGA03_14325 [Planctomycetota bacterium]
MDDRNQPRGRVFPMLLGTTLICLMAAAVGGQDSLPVGPGDSQAPQGLTAPPLMGGLASPGRNDRAAAAGPLMGFFSVDASGTQTITVVHTGKLWMAVYHVGSSGQLRLVSSRPIDADFSLELDVTSPLPSEIRRLGGATR